MSEEVPPKVVIELQEGYTFKVSFPGAKNDTFLMDEPPPLGQLNGPNASRVLSAAIANCLSASLLFCLRKGRVNVKKIITEAEPEVKRNKDGYWRVVRVNVKIYPEFDGDVDKDRVSRCLDIFENYCVVTGAVREGIDVNVDVDTVKPK
ncbi:MAG: OsmC family protein [Conexivisphaerales archaeon]